MEERENRVREWFSMWLRQDCTGLETLFCPEAVYVESWGPEYHGADQIRLWFEEWESPGDWSEMGDPAVLPARGSDGGGVAV